MRVCSFLLNETMGGGALMGLEHTTVRYATSIVNIHGTLSSSLEFPPLSHHVINMFAISVRRVRPIHNQTNQFVSLTSTTCNILMNVRLMSVCYIKWSNI